ncbi:MAG: InlB B-repeat-containing protein [Prevotellaceae bacterium]|jgi:uncharacterized repeat protein (TIGR02543 family)|nr:InlB B-repeat-containing protein [Prevotellaceae bacterium]
MRKLFNLRSVVAIATCLATVTVSSGCDPGNEPTNESSYTVKFVANGGVTAPDDQTVDKGAKATEPQAMDNPNHEDFNGWYATADFSGNPYDFNATVTANLTLYAKWGYKIGDTTPTGGKVFYVKSGATYPAWKYLEAAPAESKIDEWAKGYFDDNGDPDDADLTATWYIVEGAKGTAIGTGQANTAAIVATVLPLPAAADTEKWDFPVANYCVSYSGGGKADWFLPSKDELNALYQSKVYPASAGIKWYWTSSQHDDPNRNDNVWGQDFGTNEQGLQSESAKQSAWGTNGGYVRPVRAFFCNH